MEEVLTKVTLLRIYLKKTNHIVRGKKIRKFDNDDFLLNVKFQREVVAAMYKKLEHEEETDDLVKINLWEITESQRKAVDNTFCQTEDSNLGHVRVYSLQSLKHKSVAKLRSYGCNILLYGSNSK